MEDDRQPSDLERFYNNAWHTILKTPERCIKKVLKTVLNFQGKDHLLAQTAITRNVWCLFKPLKEQINEAISPF